MNSSIYSLRIQSKGQIAEGNFPVILGDWTPGSIVKISPNDISLSDYDVYWGACAMVKQQ